MHPNSWCIPTFPVNLGTPKTFRSWIGSQVSHGGLRWHASDTSVVAITARPQRGIDLMPCEAIVARLLAAASAWWHTTKLVFALELRSGGTLRNPKKIKRIRQIQKPFPKNQGSGKSAKTHLLNVQVAGRCAVVEKLEISHIGLVKLHSGNAGHVAVPTFGGGVVLTTAGGPFHHLLTWFATRGLKHAKHIAVNVNLFGSDFSTKFFRPNNIIKYDYKEPSETWCTAFPWLSASLFQNKIPDGGYK